MNAPAPMRLLPYRKPEQGSDYWVVDDILSDPLAVRTGSLTCGTRELGFPHTREAWPGIRTSPALTESMLASLEQTVCSLTGADKVWMQAAEGGGHLSHNCAQLVNRYEGQCRPHTDARNLCRYAAVIYLTPGAPARCGTAFYRQRMPDGSLGGNRVDAPNNHLMEALGTRFVAPDSFVEDVRIHNRFNRLLLYRANIIHSATRYCGVDIDHARMTALFFWMA